MWLTGGNARHGRVFLIMVGTGLYRRDTSTPGGVHPEFVQKILGYWQISITRDTYSHVLPSMQKEAAAKMGRALHQVDSPLRPGVLFWSQEGRQTCVDPSPLRGSSA